MSRMIIAGILVVCAANFALAQPPRKLPASLDDPSRERPAGPLSPSEATKLRENAIKALKEDLVSFEPTEVRASQIDGRWKVHSRSAVLKDFGSDRLAATEAARIILELRFNQFGTVPGSQPPFEYWLTDGKASRAVNSRTTILPVANRAIRAESVGGAWVVTDGVKGLYDFGADADAAKQAATVFWKYGFNQIGVVGEPRPVMLYPILDPRQAANDKAAPLPKPSMINVAGDVSRTSLSLPGNVYAGSKSPIDVKRLETARSKTGEWTLMHNGDELARFGSVESTARAAIKALTDAHVNEIIRIGEVGFPLFFSNGEPIHGDPLGVTKTQFHADRLKLQKLRDTWWLFDDSRPLVEVGSKTDAELLLRVVRQYDLKCLCLFGHAETGGLRLLTVGR